MLGKGVLRADSPGWALLKSSDFRYLWLGQVVSQIGDSLNKIALLWFTYQLTGSALDMALIGVLQSLPPLCLGPFLGVYIDRLSKKRLLIGVDLTRVVLITLIPVLYYFGLLTLPWIYALVFINAIVSAAFGPAMASAIPMMVDSSQLTAANGLIHSAATTGVLVGPALGGALTAVMGAQNVLYVDAATFLFSAACLALLKLAEPSADAQRSAGNMAEELKESLHFVFRYRPAIKNLMLASAFFAGGVAAFPLLLPIFAKVYLNVGSMWLGWLWSALGAGMLVITTLLAWVKQQSQSGRFLVMVVGISVASVAMIGLTWVPGPWMAMGVVALVGAGTAIFTPLMWTLLQESTPDSLRGRVFTLVGATDMASSTLAMGCMGWIAGWLGPSASLRAVSVLLLGAALVVVWIRYHELKTEGAAATYPRLA